MAEKATVHTTIFFREKIGDDARDRDCAVLVEFPMSEPDLRGIFDAECKAALRYLKTEGLIADG